jgi:hypothetical protein
VTVPTTEVRVAERVGSRAFGFVLYASDNSGSIPQTHMSASRRHGRLSSNITEGAKQLHIYFNLPYHRHKLLNSDGPPEPDSFNYTV